MDVDSQVVVDVRVDVEPAAFTLGCQVDLAEEFLVDTPNHTVAQSHIPPRLPRSTVDQAVAEFHSTFTLITQPVAHVIS